MNLAKRDKYQLTKGTSYKQATSATYSSFGTCSLLDLKLVWYLAACLLGTYFAFVPVAMSAEAVLYVSPERGTYPVGQNFEMKVLADTGGSLVNAAEAEIAFNNEALQVESISTEGSILQAWTTEPGFSNIEGTIHFAGWTKKNYNGVNGLLVTVKFKAMRNMVGSARLAAGAILAADAQASNIVTSMRSGAYTIEPEEILETPSAADDIATSSAGFPKAKVPPPTFDDFPDRVQVGDRIVVRGIAEPNAFVHVWLSRGSEAEQSYQVLTASDGSFTFVSEDKVVAGVYHLRAQVETEDGRTSFDSETLDITAFSEGAAASAVVGASLALEVLPFVALIVFAALGGAYIYHRHRIAKMHYESMTAYDEE